MATIATILGFFNQMAGELFFIAESTLKQFLHYSRRFLCDDNWFGLHPHQLSLHRNLELLNNINKIRSRFLITLSNRASLKNLTFMVM